MVEMGKCLESDGEERGVREDEKSDTEVQQLQHVFDITSHSRNAIGFVPSEY